MNYKQVIESKYNRESWQQLLHDIFLSKVTFYNRPAAVHVSSRLAKEAFNLGRISLSDGESIAVYEVELSDNVNIERNRRGIRDMLTSDWQYGICRSIHVLLSKKRKCPPLLVCQ